MPTVNVEMLKQFLDELNAKEAQNSEEIRRLDQQIQELEARIEDDCHKRLQVVAQDREKILAMKERYGVLAPIATPAAGPGGNVTAIKSPKAGGATPKVAAPDPMAATTAASGAATAPALSRKSLSKAAAPAASAKVAASAADTTGASLAKTPAADVSGANANKAPAAPTAPVATPDVVESEQPPEAADETVKNINEALRGLFR